MSGKLDPDIEFDGLCAGSEPMPDDAIGEMTIAELMEAVEADILAEAEDDRLTFWAEVIDFVNNATIGSCNPIEPASTAHSIAAW